MKNFLLAITLVACCALSVFAQQPPASFAPLNQTTLAFDSTGKPAIEASLSTTLLNGSVDSPVINVRLVIKNVGSNFYTYVTGWATFYDSAAVRCGEGLFKVDALAAGESAATDTPGLRLRCSPASWRIVATNLLTRTAEMAKPEAASPETMEERSSPINFIISIDGEEHPVQLNNPIMLQLGNRERKIVLRSAP